MSHEIVHHLKTGRLLKVSVQYLLRPVYRFGNQYPGLIKRDIWNMICYGWQAPRNNERIWVAPSEIKRVLVPTEVQRITGMTRDKTSGLMIDWNKVEKTKPLFDVFKIRYCLEHWLEGKSWDELGVIYFLKKNSMKHRSKIVRAMKEHFDMLDLAIEEVKKEGRLKIRKEIDPDNYCERDGYWYI